MFQSGKTSWRRKVQIRVYIRGGRKIGSKEEGWKWYTGRAGGEILTVQRLSEARASGSDSLFWHQVQSVTIS